MSGGSPGDPPDFHSSVSNRVLRLNLNVPSVDLGLSRETREGIVSPGGAIPDTDRVRVRTCAGRRSRLAVIRDVDMEVVVAAKAVGEAGRPVDGGDVVLAFEARIADLRRRGRAGLVKRTHRVALDDPVVLARREETAHDGGVGDRVRTYALSVDVERVTLDVEVFQVLDREAEVAAAPKAGLHQPATAGRKAGARIDDGDRRVFVWRHVVAVGGVFDPYDAVVGSQGRDRAARGARARPGVADIAGRAGGDGRRHRRVGVLVDGELDLCRVELVAEAPVRRFADYRGQVDGGRAVACSSGGRLEHVAAVLERGVLLGDLGGRCATARQVFAS